jgi:hypothetical protein
MQTTVGRGITTNANDWLDKMSMSRIKTTWVVIIYHCITLIDWNRNQQSLSISVDTILHETSQVTQVLFKDLHSGRKFRSSNLSEMG